jgi:hypothetical protein
MTPKEKAEELFNKYATYCVMWAGGINTTHQNCKQCALIAVDELIKLYEYERPHRGFKISYWDEVKQEIEKL